jgi:hypothetical protein
LLVVIRAIRRLTSADGRSPVRTFLSVGCAMMRHDRYKEVVT